MSNNQQNSTASPVAVVASNTILDNGKSGSKINNNDKLADHKNDPQSQNRYTNCGTGQGGFGPSSNAQQPNHTILTQNLNDLLSPQQQGFHAEAYSPHTPYQNMVSMPGNNGGSFSQPQHSGTNVQGSYAFTPSSNSVSHRSSAELDYNNLTRSFSNHSDFNSRLANMNSVDMLENNRKFSRHDSNGNQQQSTAFDQQPNHISQFYRSGSINETNNNNQMFFKNNSARSSQNMPYNPVASYYLSSHLSGTAIVDEEDFGSAGMENAGGNTNFNKNVFNKNNTQGNLMSNYLSGRASNGSVSFGSGNTDNVDGFEAGYNYNYATSNNPQHQFQPNQYRSSFGQQSATSSGGNYSNNIASPFQQTEIIPSISNGFNDSQQPSTTAYGRSSFGSNYSSGSGYNQQSSNGMRNSSGFVPDFCYNNNGSDMFMSQTVNRANSPDKTFNETSDIPTAIPQPATFQSRRTSSSSNNSNRPFTTNVGSLPTESTLSTRSHSIGANKSNHQKPQSPVTCVNANNNNSNNNSTFQQNTKSGSLSKSTSSSSSSSSNTTNLIPHIPVKPPVDQDALISSVKGSGLLFNESLNKQEVSDDLQDLYDLIGSNYFSQELVFQFFNDLKEKLKKEFIENVNFNSKINKFVKYLINCNEQFSLVDHLMEDKPFVTTQGKQLALVALKNGKLELLSVNKQFSQSNHLKAKNLIIIDGDRGIDLAMVVEPSLSFPLAVLVNFLKKKIHFDSLITDKNNHYKNSVFISAILAQAKHVMGSEPLMDPINPKLYDLTELTQLIIPSKQVVKFATTLDVTNNLYGKFQEELKALRFATMKLNNLNKISSNGTQTQLDIKILNSEYQFDKKKLTFYYLCEKRNDFRDLIKELFKFYKTRIWLCAIPNNLNIYQQHYFKRELLLVNGVSSQSKNEEENDKPFDKIIFDNFQIAVYIELLAQLF